MTKRHLLTATSVIFASASIALAAPTSSKRFVLPALSAGDCRMAAGAELILNKDGSATFKAKTLTVQTHNKDIWHIKFNVLDANGQAITTTPKIDSPPMDAIDTHPGYYDWAQSFRWNSGRFDSVASVQPDSEC